MSFPISVQLKALTACRRRCVLCEKFCGTHIELHHIKHRADGGEDTFENCIPLCFDCHANAGSYNPRHPKGKMYTEEELIQQRDWFYKKVLDEKNPVLSADAAEQFEMVLAILKKLFSEEKDGIDTVIGYSCPLYSYASLRAGFKGTKPETIDALVRWLAENGYVKTNITRNHFGEIEGSIKITHDGVSFFYESQ